MRRYSFIILIILLFGVIYFTNLFLKKEHSFDENLSLKQKNQDLQAQLQKVLTLGDQPLEINKEYLSAKIFSTYPFNTKNKITINLGEKQGVKKMMAVTIEKNILVGQIIDVFENSSIVQTIFDPDFQLPVRIGDKEIDGLFQGGSESKVVLIEKDKPLQINDIVYSASQEFSYGLKIGEITEIKDSAAGVFKEAILKMPFNVSELREVNVLINNL